MMYIMSLILLVLANNAHAFELQSIEYVPTTVHNIPAYCIGDDNSHSNCYHSCFISSNDESNYICLFLKPQDTKNKKHFVNGEAVCSIL